MRESVSLIDLHLQSEVVSRQNKISYLQTGSRFSDVDDDAPMTVQRRPKDDILSFKKKFEVRILMNEPFKVSLVFQSSASSLCEGRFSVYKLKVIRWNCF